jgi:hypothetical protein
VRIPGIGFPGMGMPYQFSQYFADRDNSEILVYYDKKVTDTRY